MERSGFVNGGERSTNKEESLEYTDGDWTAYVVCAHDNGGVCPSCATTAHDARERALLPSAEYPDGVYAPRIVVDEINAIFREHGIAPIETIA